MPDFKCIICGVVFSVPSQTLKKYPNWRPKYCRRHSPVKKNVEQAAAPLQTHTSFTAFKDLTPEDVLKSFSEGPQSGIFTDGGARPNPGPGGWGVVYVKDGEILQELSGGEKLTTNNRMELTALMEGIKLITPEEAVTIYTDSELCANTINQWAAAWQKQGWKRKTGKVENLDLVKPLYEMFQARPLAKLKWIKAHNGWLWNEYADALASTALKMHSKKQDVAGRA